MIQRNRAGQDVRAGEVFEECAEKKRFPCFELFRQGNNYALRGPKRFPKKRCISATELILKWAGVENRNPG